MKLPFWATFFTICGVVVLCGLGTWQLQRLEWKRGILEKIEASKKTDSVFSFKDFEDEDNLYLHGHVKGRYLNDKSFKIGPRTYEGAPGYHVITPFALEGGGTVLVNRGWIGLNDKEGKDLKGARTLKGVIRRPDRGNPFTPSNDPQNDAWYVIDSEQIAHVKALRSLPALMLYLEEDGSGERNGMVTSVLHAAPPNSHLQYALFWFSLAGVLVVIYILRFIRRQV